jgi:rubrerythrin
MIPETHETEARLAAAADGGTTMSKVTLEQAIRDAIEVERSAAQFYEVLGANTDDDEAKEFLARMVAEEKAHERSIAEMGQKLTSGELPARASDNCEMVETAPDWAYAEGLDYRAALAVALEAEQHAALFYDAVADGFSEPRIRQFFVTLARTEEQHVAALEARLRVLE